MERLDRAMANVDLFPVHRVDVLATRSVDHAPVLLFFQKHTHSRQKRKGLFRYEMAGRKGQQQKEIIHKIWKIKKDHREGWNPVLKKLEECKENLLQWQKKNKNTSAEAINQTTQRILELQGEEDFGMLMNLEHFKIRLMI